MIAAERSSAFRRLFLACVLAAVCLSWTGCTTLSGPSFSDGHGTMRSGQALGRSNKSSGMNPLSGMQLGFASKEDKAFRKRVEKDAFPTAAEAGL